MIIGSCQLDLHIPASQSLKQKRQVIKRIVDQIRNRFNVSVSETGANDLWQRTQLGIVCVSGDRGMVESMIASVLRYIEMQGDVEILDEIIEYL